MISRSGTAPTRQSIAAITAGPKAGVLAADLRGAERTVTAVASAHQLLDHPCPPACDRWKNGGPDHAIGGSRGGLSARIHAVVADLGLPVRLLLIPGQASDKTTFPEADRRCEPGTRRRGRPWLFRGLHHRPDRGMRRPWLTQGRPRSSSGSRPPARARRGRCRGGQGSQVKGELAGSARLWRIRRPFSQAGAAWLLHGTSAYSQSQGPFAPSPALGRYQAVAATSRARSLILRAVAPAKRSASTRSCPSRWCRSSAVGLSGAGRAA